MCFNGAKHSSTPCQLKPLFPFLTGLAAEQLRHFILEKISGIFYLESLYLKFFFEFFFEIFFENFF
jgi:hypothetical protein